MSIDARQLDANLKRLSGVEQFLGKKEIKELPNILHDDEQVTDLAGGTYANGNGLLVATDRRVIFVDKGMIYGLKVEDFPLDKISSIQYETGMLLASITIFTSGNRAVIKNVDKTRARVFAEGIRARISGPKAAATQVPAVTVTTTAISPIEELERLAALKERGLVTEEEFSARKRALLGI